MENKAPKWLLWVGVLLILWNLIGVAAFVSQYMMSAADLAKLPQEQQMMWAQKPQWSWISYALAVAGGLLSAVGITLKKRWSVPASWVDVLGVVGTFFPTFFMVSGVNVWQAQYVGLPLFILVIALLQLWLARKGEAAGWFH